MRTVLYSMMIIITLLPAVYAQRALKEFPIGMWCAPPVAQTTEERYKEIANAGFTIVLPPCDGRGELADNRKILEASRSAGLKAIIQDSRMPRSMEEPDAQKRIDAILQDYGRNSAIAGWFLCDEPSAADFSGWATVVAALKKADPGLPGYINLFPGYASPAQLGAESYDRYVELFNETVKPSILSFDHYPLLKTGDRPELFQDLSIIRAAANSRNRPFWMVLLCTPHGAYRAPTEAEKRWEAMQALAYGAGGILWFTYWTPTDPSFVWEPGIIGPDGKPSAQYEQIKRINADVRAMGKYLLNSVQVTVFQSGNISPGGTPREQGTPVKVASGGDLTVGIYRADTHLYALIANRDYRKSVEATFLFTVSSDRAQILDRNTGRWREIKGKRNEEKDMEIVQEFPAGDAMLFRW